MKKLILFVAVAVAVGVGGIALGLRMRGISFGEVVELCKDVVKARTTRRTTEGVVSEIEKAKPALAPIWERRTRHADVRPRRPRRLRRRKEARGMLVELTFKTERRMNDGMKYERIKAPY